MRWDFLLAAYKTDPIIKKTAQEGERKNINEPEQRIFKSRYTEKEFSKCIADEKFKQVWEHGNLDQAGELATLILNFGLAGRLVS
jgi:hypothetical protein